MKALVFYCATVLSPLALTSTAAAQPAAGTAAPAAAAPAAPAAADPAPATPAAADPAAAPAVDPAAPAPATGAAAPVPPDSPVVDGDTPPELKRTCMAAINSDQRWTDELSAMVQKKMRYDAHNSEAQLIAMNKRHVVLAYAVLWLLTVGFLLAQWRRQQALKRQIEGLQRDLESAIKGPAA